MQLGLVGTTILDNYLRENVFRASLAIFDENIPVVIAVEDTSINQLEFIVLQTAPAVFIHQARIRECRLGILVEHSQIRMRRSSVKIVVVLLDILAVISLPI